MNILIAEDDSTFREILKKMVAAHGAHQVTVAANGSEAWSYLDDPNRLFDAMFLDLSMPELDGFQLLSLIRESPMLRSVQIVVCTAATDRASVAKAIQGGVLHYLVKPSTEAAVAAKLKLIEAQVAAAS